MNVPGKMYRALTMDWIPAGRIREAIELRVETDSARRIFYRGTYYSPGRIPRGPTGCTADHANVGYDAIFDINFEFRGTEPFTIVTKTDLPWKPTSGGRLQYPFVIYFFS